MKWLIPIAILLTGCAGKETVIETVEVEKPIPIPCIEQKAIPDPVAPASESITIESSPGEKIKAILVENRRLRAQNGTFRALVGPCIK